MLELVQAVAQILQFIGSDRVGGHLIGEVGDLGLLVFDNGLLFLVAGDQIGYQTHIVHSIEVEFGFYFISKAVQN